METKTTKPQPIVDAEKLQYAADIMKAIAHPVRIRIIELLEQKEKMNVGEFMEALDEEQAVISHHLIRMKDRGILHSEKEGKFRYYRIAEKEITGIIHCISNCRR